MLMGAIVGAIVGVIMLAVMLIRNGGRMKGLDVALAKGPEAARAFVDQKYAARANVQTPQMSVSARERFAALARIPDAAAITRELGELVGPDKHVDLARNLGYLALALIGPSPADAAQRLTDLVARVESERRYGKSVRAVLARQAAVARALAGLEPVPATKDLVAFSSDHADGGVIEALAKQCRARLLERQRAAAPAAA